MPRPSHSKRPSIRTTTPSRKHTTTTADAAASAPARAADERPHLVCLDLEGVLMPEVWIALATAFDVPELRLTTRDIDDYDELMTRRLRAVAEHGITMSAITEVIGALEPLDGARTFMARLRRDAQVIILSDTFLQFWEPMAPHLDYPTIFCNTLVVENDRVVDYRMRIDDGKRRSVEAFRDLGFRTTAAGDSFNDISMLRAADRGILFRPSPQVISAHGDLAVTDTYEALLDRILAPPAARG